MTERTNGDLNLVANWFMRDAVDIAMSIAMDWSVNNAVRWVVNWDVDDAVDGVVHWSVDRAVRDTVHDVVYWAVRDPKHPSLQEFLHSCGIEVGVETQ